MPPAVIRGPSVMEGPRVINNLGGSIRRALNDENLDYTRGACVLDEALKPPREGE